MTEIKVERLSFSFPEGWDASKYDDWSFYRDKFLKQFNGIAAVDIIALNTEGDVYLIEAKDYRHPKTQKPSEVPLVIAHKVVMTLAAMLPASLHASDENEKRIAKSVLGCKNIRVVAHIELSHKCKFKIVQAHIKQKLGQLLRAVDTHPKVVSMSDMKGLQWHVA